MSINGGNSEKRAENATSNEDYDVIIVGAGLGGINSAYRMQTEIPGCKYTILEQRSNLGGTWSLFQYPGIRSDSDLHTFGFEFRPWNQHNAIAEGSSIIKYVEETVDEFHIRENIQFDTAVTTANWSTSEKRWTLETSHEQLGKRTHHASFLIMASGYYDYKEPLPTLIPGLEKFKGVKVHPQFWPTEMDYSDKEIVIVGSGATAITLLPNLAKKAKHVTMLQRSPGYIIGMPQRDPIDRLAARILPVAWAFRFIRWKFLTLPLMFYNFCCRFPNVARRVLRWQTMRQLPPNISHDPHFVPSYDPWAQRLCLAPDGDFYTGLRTGKCNIATGVIDTVEQDGILLQSGERLKADIIVTATGLRMQLGGRVAITVDEKPVELNTKYLWRSAMLQDVPNLSFIIGYVNASWTLGADVTAFLTVRLMKHMKQNGYKSCTPRVRDEQQLNNVPVFNLNSTYVQKAMDSFPKAGDVGPWRGRTDYFKDMRDAKKGSLTDGMEYSA